MAEEEAEVGSPDFLTGIVEVLRIEGANSYMNQNQRNHQDPPVFKLIALEMILCT